MRLFGRSPLLNVAYIQRRDPTVLSRIALQHWLA